MYVFPNKMRLPHTRKGKKAVAWTASAWMDVGDEASGNTELLTTRVMMCACTRVPVYSQEGSMLQYGDLYYSIYHVIEPCHKGVFIPSYSGELL